MKSYKVVGSQAILDHKPGETFEAKNPADLEAYLVGIGGLKVIEKPKALKSADRY